MAAAARRAFGNGAGQMKWCSRKNRELTVKMGIKGSFIGNINQSRGYAGMSGKLCQLLGVTVGNRYTVIARLGQKMGNRPANLACANDGNVFHDRSPDAFDEPSVWSRSLSIHSGKMSVFAYNNGRFAERIEHNAGLR